MTAPISGFGMIIKLGTAIVSPTFATVVNLETISLAGFTRETLDVFTHDNATGIAERVVAALAVLGAATFTVAWDPADTSHSSSTGILENCLDGEERPWQLVFPDTGAEQFDFQAVITDFSWPELAANVSIMRMDVTVSLTTTITVV